MEVVLIVPIGGGLIYFAGFVLFALFSYSKEFCIEWMQFFIDNTVTIAVIVGVVALLCAIIAGSDKFKYGPATFLLVGHYLLSIVYGVYGVLYNARENFFFLIMCIIIYLAVVVIHTVIMGGLLIFCQEHHVIWPIYPVCIGLSVFLYFFY
ncbi:MAG: hypothetical protein E7578_05555 [Ruminococcaceae bacterium]|nr:hypothetical protein [Oscillospiraceae bacterium]